MGPVGNFETLHQWRYSGAVLLESFLISLANSTFPRAPTSTSTWDSRHLKITAKILGPCSHLFDGVESSTGFVDKRKDSVLWYENPHHDTTMKSLPRETYEVIQFPRRVSEEDSKRWRISSRRSVMRTPPCQRLFHDTFRASQNTLVLAKDWKLNADENDVLVLNIEGYGCLDNNDITKLKSFKGSIIVKLELELEPPNPQSELFVDRTKEVLELTRTHTGRTVVVFDVEDLRRQEIMISKGLSHERTCQSLLYFLKSKDEQIGYPDSLGDKFKNARNTIRQLARAAAAIVVSFEGDGIFVYCHHEQLDHTKAALIASPRGTEGHFQRSLPGEMRAMHTALTAIVAYKVATIQNQGLYERIISEGERMLVALRFIKLHGFTRCVPTACSKEMYGPYVFYPDVGVFRTKSSLEDAHRDDFKRERLARLYYPMDEVGEIIREGNLESVGWIPYSIYGDLSRSEIETVNDAIHRTNQSRKDNPFKESGVRSDVFLLPRKVTNESGQEHLDAFRLAQEGIRSWIKPVLDEIVRDSVQASRVVRFDLSVSDILYQHDESMPENHSYYTRNWWTICGLDRITPNVALGEKDILSIAREIAKNGLAKVASERKFPYGEFGRYETVDRAEIEDLRELEAYIDQVYLSTRNGPYNVLVIGEPGAGKSFAVKEIIETGGIPRDQRMILTFNLSQFEGPEQLDHAFREVSEACLSGKFPVVFWDEFDTQFAGKPFAWMPWFLEPMQDRTYRGRERTRPIGKCLFIFAGSRIRSVEELILISSSRYEERIELWKEEHIKKENGKGTEERKASMHENMIRRVEGLAPGFRRAKGEDFISRVKRVLHISGLNPPSADSLVPKAVADDPIYKFGFLIRRATVLRSFISKDFKELLDGQLLAMSDRVLDAFLDGRVEYEHGARSISAILETARLSDASFLDPSRMSSASQLSLHVNSREFERNYGPEF